MKKSEVKPMSNGQLLKSFERICFNLTNYDRKSDHKEFSIVLDELSERLNITEEEKQDIMNL